MGTRRSAFPRFPRSGILPQPRAAPRPGPGRPLYQALLRRRDVRSRGLPHVCSARLLLGAAHPVVVNSVLGPSRTKLTAWLQGLKPDVNVGWPLETELALD